MHRGLGFILQLFSVPCHGGKPSAQNSLRSCLNQLGPVYFALFLYFALILYSFIEFFLLAFALR